MSIDEIAAVAKQLKRANDGTADHSTAMVNAVGLVLGLYARERTGSAQYVESTMIAANAYLNIDDFYWHVGKQPRPLPDRDGYGLHALYRLYQAKTGWVFLACLFEDEWEALCRTIDRRDLRDDPRFAIREAREKNDDALADELAEVFASEDPLHWEKLLTAADVACVKAEDRGMYSSSTKTNTCVITAFSQKWKRPGTASSGGTLLWSLSRKPQDGLVRGR